jgi:hypothetical protein
VAAALADLGSDAAFAELVAEGVAAVTAVGPDLCRLVAGRGQAVEQRQQMGAFVFVAGPEPYLERPAVGVDD